MYFTKISLLLVLFCAISSAKVIITGINLDITNEGDLGLIKSSSEFVLLPEEASSLQDLRRYVGGQRVSGDGIVAHTSKNQRYATAQNVKVDLRYPASGMGKLVTYVEVTVNQTSAQGSAVISSGGFGQHYIGITVYAQNTYQMDYSAIIYGL